MVKYPRGLAVGFAAGLGVGVVSCGRTDPPPTAPLPPIVTQPRPTVGISGVVFDHTASGVIPRANVRLLARVYQSHAFIEVTSDAMGRFSVPEVAAGPISIAAARGSGYYSPCPAGSNDVPSNRVLDVHVVSAARLLVSGIPSELPLASIWVTGVVYERTDRGNLPVAGATVTLDGDESDTRLGSTTLTDAGGNYLVCPPIPGTGTDMYGSIRVEREGYRTANRSAFLGWDYDGVDIELVRK